jgi:hypothetical protein
VSQSAHIKNEYNHREEKNKRKEVQKNMTQQKTPFLREINVFWHVGDSGSGKSYTSKLLADTVGEDKVYFVTNYANGYLDRYTFEPILFLDEFRGQINFETLLTMLQGYKVLIPCRYRNIVGMWNEVHITSLLPPEKVYKNISSENLQPLRRRITTIVYHWKNEAGQPKTFELPMNEYSNYEDLKQKALGSN